MKALFFLALLALAYCDDSTTSYILIGNWVLQSGTLTVTSSSLCCMPTGDLTIINNSDNTVTMTSTGWSGAECQGRLSTYSDVLSVDGADSWSQLVGANQVITIPDASSSTEYSIVLSFNDGVSLHLTNGEITDDQTCYGNWEKSAKWMSVTGAGLIAVIASLLI